MVEERTWKKHQIQFFNFHSSQPRGYEQDVEILDFLLQDFSSSMCGLLCPPSKPSSLFKVLLKNILNPTWLTLKGTLPEYYLEVRVERVWGEVR